MIFLCALPIIQQIASLYVLAGNQVNGGELVIGVGKSGLS